MRGRGGAGSSISRPARAWSKSGGSMPLPCISVMNDGSTRYLGRSQTQMAVRRMSQSDDAVAPLGTRHNAMRTAGTMSRAMPRSPHTHFAVTPHGSTRTDSSDVNRKPAGPNGLPVLTAVSGVVTSLPVAREPSQTSRRRGRRRGAAHELIATRFGIQQTTRLTRRRRGAASAATAR